MKKQILDTPFRHSFSDFLKKDETILWEGAPSLKVPTSNNSEDLNLVFLFIIMIGSILILLGIAMFPLLSAGVLILVVFGSYFVYLKNNQKHHIRYAITPRQVIFQLPTKWFNASIFHSILMTNIRQVEVHEETDYHNVGVIFLTLHNSKSVNFTTRNLRFGKKRYLPTLELIDDPKRIAKLIQDHARS